jgi:hypothetical protein
MSTAKTETSRTAMKHCTAKALGVAVRVARLHGNMAFAVRQHAFSLFFFLFYFI